MSTVNVYADYVRLYLLMNYSKNDSEFYALCEEKTRREPGAPWERPEIRFANIPKPGAPEIPEKEDAVVADSHPRKRRRRRRRRQNTEDAPSQKKESQPMLQSMV